MSFMNLLWFGGYGVGSVIGGIPGAADVDGQRLLLGVLSGLPLLLVLAAGAVRAVRSTTDAAHAEGMATIELR